MGVHIFICSLPQGGERMSKSSYVRWAIMSTDPGPAAPTPPDRYDVRVVLDGEEAEALNHVRQYLTVRTGGAINVTVSDTIRYALKSCAWALQPDEDEGNGKLK